MSKRLIKYHDFSTLQFLNSPFSILKNVAEFFEKNLVNLIGKNKLFNLLLLRPSRFESILFCPKLFEVQSDALVVLKLKIEAHIKPENRRQPYKIVGYSPTGFVNLIFFKTYPGQMEKLAVGREIAVLGVLNKSLSENQITHPLEIVDAQKIDELPRENIVYPLSGVLTQKFLRAKIVEILKFLDARFDEEKAKNNDWIDKNLREKQGWPLFVPAFKALHNFGLKDSNNAPMSEIAQQKALQRLKYDELLSWQIAMMLVRRREEKTKPMPEICDERAEEFLRSLPFAPTNAQMKAADEIRQNMLSPKTMLRLLQGDVGSGKTIVAIYSCLLAVSCGKQACVVVPISILADQHFAYFKRLLGDSGALNSSSKAKMASLPKIPVIEILTAKTKKSQREKILRNLREGKIDILIGTHAVLQDDVEFADLGLAVIDEQHRFGVMQRLKLVEKGKDVDVLLMSATPIPRSLMMSFYGDMDISILDEKPANRLAIDTLVKSQNAAGDVFDGVKRALLRGEKVYWICPMIEDVDDDDSQGNADAPQEPLLQSVEAKHKELQKIFGEEKVAMIHGKMKAAQKEEIMENFKLRNDEKSPQILVATTVIEVGVDVPDATIIVIENAENFGLSQLHQLRGRVGRSDKKSYCILLYGKKYGKIAQERLKTMRESNDGFFIAEEDLKLRGSGEMLGTKQSGMPQFNIADLETDLDLLKIASKNAQVILNEDEKLSEVKSAKFRVLLKLFDYEDCLKIISGG